MENGTRINKYLASCGIGSRRAVESDILGGRVRVNGVIEKDLSRKITESDKVEINGTPIKCQSRKVYIALYKPRGIVTTCKDQFGRESVLDLLQGVPERVFPVGRLDYDSEGLLLLTNDGDFARRLTHPSFEVDKTYEAILNKKITQKELEQLSCGIVIDGVKTAPAKARLISQNPTCVEIVIHEGRNRQVRKMFEAVDAKVIKLKRTAIGKWTLGDLLPGEWRYIVVS